MRRAGDLAPRLRSSQCGSLGFARPPGDNEQLEATEERAAVTGNERSRPAQLRRPASSLHFL